MAVAQSRGRSTPILLGRELVVLAAARRRQGATDVAALLEEASAIALRTGAAIINDDARLFLGHARPAGDEHGLTAREREVMELVRVGHTNQQIARSLGIAPTTVRTHLEHIFAKLDVSTRTVASTG